MARTCQIMTKKLICQAKEPVLASYSRSLLGWKNNKWSFLELQYIPRNMHTVYALLCFCGYTLTDFPITIRLTSLALWQSNDCPSASKATLMNMDKYFMWIHYERLHNHNKAKHTKTVCILGYTVLDNMEGVSKSLCQVYSLFGMVSIQFYLHSFTWLYLFGMYIDVVLEPVFEWTIP